jgi:aspartyl-tRNA(Asn)/glutamyl-tRNA(Gln) amidotransferase subunit A
LGRALANRELSAVEATQAYLDQISSLDPGFRAYITVSEEWALEQAHRAQVRLDEGTGGPLTGVPIALKDNISTAGLRTTCGSKILENYVPPFDATVVEKLAGAGCIVLGKTNLDEFAMGTSTENSAFFPTRNPWDPDRSPGGSSGGSAAAVAAELAAISFGSDTGGSIRQPAALCGVVGFKPSYGRCSRFGLVAFASSLDQIGPLGRSVEDVALAAEAITGHDTKDSTSISTGPISGAGLKSGTIRGLRVGIPREFFSDSMSAGVLSEVHRAIETLKREGVEFEEISLPSILYGVTTYYIIAPAEASSNLARFDGVRYGPRVEGASHVDMVEKTRARLFGHEVKARIMIGTYALSAGYYDAYYIRAQQVRAKMAQEFQSAFGRFDILLGPTSPVPAFKLGGLDPIQLKMLDYCTIPANLTGSPAISLNCGLAEGLPVGLHLMAAPGQDERLLQVAYSVEQALGESRRPPLP